MTRNVGRRDKSIFIAYRDINLPDIAHRSSFRAFCMPAVRRYFNLPWVGVHTFWFHVLQLMLGFYSPYLKKVLVTFPFVSKTRVSSNKYVRCTSVFYKLREPTGSDETHLSHKIIVLYNGKYQFHCKSESYCWSVSALGRGHYLVFGRWNLPAGTRASRTAINVVEWRTKQTDLPLPSHNQCRPVRQLC